MTEVVLSRAIPKRRTTTRTATETTAQSEARSPVGNRYSGRTAVEGKKGAEKNPNLIALALPR